MSVQPYIPDNELSAWHSPRPLAAQINPLLTHSAPLLKQTDWILLPFDCLVGGSSAGWQAPDRDSSGGDSDRDAGTDGFIVHNARG